MESREIQAQDTEDLARLSWQAGVDQLEAAIDETERGGFRSRVMIWVIGGGVIAAKLRGLGADQSPLMWILPTAFVLSAMTGIVGFNYFRTARKLRTLRAQLSSLLNDDLGGRGVAVHPIEPVKPVQTDGRGDLAQLGR